MDQGSNKNHSPAYNFTPTVTKFCVMWEGLSLPHDTKFGNCRCKIVDSRSFHSWSLIHGLRWSGLIKVGPDLNSLFPWRCSSNLKFVIKHFQTHISAYHILCISIEIALIWMLQDPSDDKSAMVQVIALFFQAIGYCLSNVDPVLCCHMASLSHNELICHWFPVTSINSCHH